MNYTKFRLTAAKLCCPCNTLRASNSFARSDTGVVIYSEPHPCRTCKSSLVFAPLAVRVQAGYSAFPFYTPTKLLIRLYFKCKTVPIPLIIMKVRVSCNVNVKNFARDPKYSWFHEHYKYWIHFLNTCRRTTIRLLQYILSRDMKFPTMWYVRPAKAQASLRLCAVWSEPLLVASILYTY